MNLIKSIFFFSITIFCFSCGQGGGANAPSAHFSISSHLDTLPERWGANLQVKKYVKIGVQEEEQIIGKDEFIEDLGFFKKLDIDRNSYLGRYDVDTVSNNEKMTVNYTSNNNSMEINDQKFELDKSGLQYFFSNREYNSVVSDYILKVEIQGDTLFLIDQTQDIPGKATQTLIIRYTIASL